MSIQEARRETMLLAQYVTQDQATGVLLWNVRPRESFASERGMKMFNTMFAGKPAGTLCAQGYIRIWFMKRKIAAHRVVFFHA